MCCSSICLICNHCSTVVPCTCAEAVDGRNFYSINIHISITVACIFFLLVSDDDFATLHRESEWCVTSATVMHPVVFVCPYRSCLFFEAANVRNDRSIKLYVLKIFVC